MLYSRINRSDPDKVFMVVKNSYSTAALSNGQAVIWDFLTDADGVGVTKPTAIATNAGFAFAGIVTEDIAIGGYGLIQIYGYHSGIRAHSITAGTPAIAKGRPLCLNAAGGEFCMESFNTGATVDLIFPQAFAMAANALWTTAAIAGFIKAM